MRCRLSKVKLLASSIIIFCVVLLIWQKSKVKSPVNSHRTLHRMPPFPSVSSAVEDRPRYLTHRLPLPTAANISYGDDLHNDVTVVTAYFNLGKFKKGEDGSTFFEPNIYRMWMRVFRRIRNPVIAYFDDPQDLAYFSQLRADLPENMTTATLVSRDDLWAFGLYARLTELYTQPDYPRYYPNTVYPEYTSAMHAKYELLLRALSGGGQRQRQTKHICWLDVGLFRELARDPGPAFHLTLPSGFDDTAVSYTEVFPLMKDRLSLEQIFFSNAVWVCGCFFIAQRQVMQKWALQYMQYTEQYLSLGYSNTDQQVLYAMKNRGQTGVKVRTYTSDGTFNKWFYLGYLCKQDING